MSGCEKCINASGRMFRLSEKVRDSGRLILTLRKRDVRLPDGLHGPVSDDAGDAAVWQAKAVLPPHS